MSENRNQNYQQRSSSAATAPKMSKEELHRQMQQSLSGGQKPPSQPLRQRKNTSNKRVSELSEKQTSTSSRRRSQSPRTAAEQTQPRTAAEDKMEKMRRIKESMNAIGENSGRGGQNASTAEEAHRYVQRQASSSRRKRNLDDTYDYEVPRNYRQNQMRQKTQAAVAKKNKIGIILICAVIIVILLAYIVGMLMCSRGFLPKTYMNGVDIGGMSMDEAIDAVVHEGEVQGITFVKKNGEEIHFEGQEFGSAISLADETAFQKAADQNVFFWFVNYLSPAKYTTKLVNTYDESKLATLVRNYTWGTAPPTDAYLQKQSDGSYTVIPEDDGDMIDVEKLVDYTLEQVRNGKSVIELTACDCYMKAEKTAESLQAALEEANSLMGLTITYDFSDRTEVLDSATIIEWVSSDSSGNMTVDENAVQAWVQTNLADKYDTFVSGYTRTFHSTLQGTIQLPLGEDGIYGWKTDVTATTEKLIEYIKAGESVTVEPEYSQRAYRRETDDIGNTYIEVDITNQHVWYYVDGSLLMDSDCVTGTGTDPTRQTPTGVFRVWSRESPKVLEGEGYSAPVQYWMPVTWTGVGLHDLDRTEYGGDIYMYNGSHGCINLPVDFAEQLFYTVDVGTPVLIIP
ncbi:MAG: L,D-transpeptidase family protein [Ruminococcus sp.]